MTILPALFLALILGQTTQQQAPPSGALVEGVVVDFGSGAPIEGATVELRATQASNALRAIVQLGEFLPGMPQPLTVITGSDGKFSFKDPAVGEYRLYATRPREHIPTEYGQRTPTGTGTPFTIAAGQKISGVSLRMGRVGAISGRIFDASGDPVTYASVEVVRSGYIDGKRRLIRVQLARTDDRGAYRFYNLAPGQYYVTARPWDARSTRGMPGSEPTIVPNRNAGAEGATSPLITRRVLESGEIVEETWLNIYYPGTPDPRAARAISLNMGQNIDGIDISLALSAVPARRVRGVVLDGTTGAPVAGALIRLIPQEPLTAAVVMPMAVAEANGAFEVPGVLPAKYSLYVSNPVTAYMVIDAGSGDVQNLKIVGVRPVDIPVRVTLDEGAALIPLPPAPAVPSVVRTAIGPNGEIITLGAPTPPSTSLRVTLTREPGTGSPTGAFVITAGWPGIPQNAVSPPIQAAASGLMLRNVELGDFRVSLGGLAAGSYVKSIRRGQADVLRDGLHIAGPATPTDDPLEIFIGANAGILTGRVLNDAGAPAPNVTVALVPNPQRRSRLDLYQSVSTDANGAFRFQGIVPDEYKLFAWEEIIAGAWVDSDVLAPYENRGHVVTVGHGSNAPQELKMIPWRNP